MKAGQTRAGCVVKINPRLYNLRVIYSAAYIFLDRAYVFLDGSPRTRVTVRITAKDGSDPGKIAGEFMNELLNASLRYQISQENKKIREYIVGSALISVSEKRPHEKGNRYAAQCDQRDKHSAVNWQQRKQRRSVRDPLGISIPWEDKYGTIDKG